VSAVRQCLTSGSIPEQLKESLTVVLKKDSKKDYSLPSSYRPITLENTLAKVIEKLVAEAITDTMEEQDLLSWNQMGARKKRSTLSALSVLTTCVQTVWKAHPGCVASMLSLDLAGAFDNVSHKWLLHILWKKGLPTWVVRIVESFLTARKTKIIFTGYESS